MYFPVLPTGNAMQGNFPARAIRKIVIGLKPRYLLASLAPINGEGETAIGVMVAVVEPGSARRRCVCVLVTVQPHHSEIADGLQPYTAAELRLCPYHAR